MSRRISFTVEKNRVLVPVGEPCPFNCRYCYTRGGEVGPARVSTAEILSHFRHFAQKTAFETIQFGYDGDPFARPEHGIVMLKQLCTMGKHVNFSTKALLEGETLDMLHEMRCQMDVAGTTLSALVSLSCWDSAPVVEPHTPTPSQRIQTVANLKRIELPVFIAVRPILPHIPDREYERIVDEGLHVGCDGFILGPLYSDARGQFVRFIPPTALAGLKSKRGNVPWSAHTLTWTRYEDTDRLQRLQLMIERKGGCAFLSSADVMARVCRGRKVA